MPAPRAYWKGYLKLSFVSCPIALYDPSMLEDHYRNALVRILRKKKAKRPAHHAAPVKPSRENVVNLMDALRRSIAAEHPAKAAPRRGLRKSARPKRPARARTVR